MSLPGGRLYLLAARRRQDMTQGKFNVGSPRSSIQKITQPPPIGCASIGITTDHPSSVQWGLYCCGQLFSDTVLFWIIFSTALCPPTKTQLSCTLFEDTSGRQIHFIHLRTDTTLWSWCKASETLKRLNYNCTTAVLISHTKIILGVLTLQEIRSCIKFGIDQYILV